jgi:serine/threonine-protein kinase RsbW
MPSPPEDSGPTRRDDDSEATVPDLHYEAVPAHADRLTAFRQILTRWATSVGMLTGCVQALTLAVYEAMANVVTHAYRGRPEGGVFDLHAVRSADRRQVTVTVTDFGRWQLKDVSESDDQLRTSGRGVQLIRALSDAAVIHTDARGTTIHMKWQLA